MHRVRWTWVACALFSIAVLLPLHAAAITIDQNDDSMIVGEGVELDGDDIPTGEESPGQCGNDCIPVPEPDDLGPGDDDDVFEGPIDGELPGPIDDDIVPPSVPEPATLTMLGIGLAGLFAMGRRRR